MTDMRHNVERYFEEFLKYRARGQGKRARLAVRARHCTFCAGTVTFEVWDEDKKFMGQVALKVCDIQAMSGHIVTFVASLF